MFFALRAYCQNVVLSQPRINVFMSNSLLSLQQVNSFFESYAAALENYDTKGMAALYNIPCTLISDDTTTLFNDPTKLEGFFNMGAGFYRQFGIARVRPVIWNTKELTAKIINVKVNWAYFDQNEKPIYKCDYYYVLKADKNNMWKIILSVSVNEKERMEEWKGKGG
jgi:hypothetical protein